MIHQSKTELSTPQKNCVQFKPEGDLLIQGIPGSGKSTILLARASYLAEINPEESILLLTFSRALTNYMGQLALKTYNMSLSAKTFHQWGQELLEKTDYPYTRLILGENRKNTINFAKNIVKKHNKNSSFPNMNVEKHKNRKLLEFLCDEIEWIKGTGITSREKYLNVKRSGRGGDIRVTKENRQTIYDVLEKYNELLKNHPRHQGIDGDDLARILVEKNDQIPDNLRPDHILVDEAQDLFTMQLKAISSTSKKSVTVGADKGQQIYRRTFTWKQAGIDVMGNRSRFLKQTFRSTKQIIELANNFQEKDKLYVEDPDYQKASLPEIEGKMPELMFSPDMSMEKQAIIEQVSKIRSNYPDDTIGVIATSHDKLDKFGKLLDERGVPVYKVKEDEADFISPGAKLITFHSSKGLEFDHVIITGLTKGKLPYKHLSPGEDQEEFMSRERKKLYVAMTRAKKTLLLIAVKEYSPFVNDLIPELYETVNLE
ncbi:3'-5' exonuclease [Lentibacillus sediminis]|uniref:3'-5' exonuclease n=1 Tax=Lentibacillus sediminis TaxID=1940529 RepID=UPI000C1C38BD|nr:3'-5' exonuclease [Lentibacillus sediminis]